MSGFPKYIHLRVHTEYSLLEGATRLKKLPELCKANDMPAIALTETNNLFSALEFSVLFKDNGLQPIIGCQIDFRFTDMGSERRARTTAPIVLLAKDEPGYKNLMKLSSEMYVQNDESISTIPIIPFISKKFNDLELIYKKKCNEGWKETPSNIHPVGEYSIELVYKKK